MCVVYIIDLIMSILIFAIDLYIEIVHLFKIQSENSIIRKFRSINSLNKWIWVICTHIGFTISIIFNLYTITNSNIEDVVILTFIFVISLYIAMFISLLYNILRLGKLFSLATSIIVLILISYLIMGFTINCENFQFAFYFMLAYFPLLTIPLLTGFLPFFKQLISNHNKIFKNFTSLNPYICYGFIEWVSIFGIIVTIVSLVNDCCDIELVLVFYVSIYFIAPLSLLSILVIIYTKIIDTIDQYGMAYKINDIFKSDKK